MDQFLERHKLPKLIQGEIKWIVLYLLKTSNSWLPKKKTLGPDDFTGEFY